MASSMSSPAILMEDLVTMPPSEITATSLVPPPTSTIIDPCASLTGSPAPMAAASGSSMVNACRAPADSVASFTGLSATMLPGVRPSMRLAPEPTATTLSVLLSMATTEGSESTIPWPLTNTSVFAVPRSIATSRPKSPPNILLTSPFRRYALAPHGLEHPVFFHTIVAIAHDNVVEHLYTQYPGGLHEPTGGFAILWTGLDLAAGMIVHEHHARRTRPDGRLENLPGMDEGGGKRAYTDQRGPYNLVFGV